MSAFRILLLLLLFLLPTSKPAMASWFAEGGNEVGNGGDVVICIDDDGRSETFEVLDSFEARVMRDILVDMDGLGGDYLEKAAGVIHRITEIDPDRAQRYLDDLNKFLSQTKFLEQTDLPDIPDTNHFPLPNDCLIKQAVIQRKVTFPHDFRYFINAWIWSNLDENQRAILILHEIIYLDSLRHGNTSSEEARYFNSLLFGNDNIIRDGNAYAEILRRTRLDRIAWLDEKTGKLWELSEHAYANQRDALGFCYSTRRMVPATVKDLIEVLPVMLNSYIGDYYIVEPSVLTVWAHDPISEDDANPAWSVDITVNSVANAKEKNGTFRIFCVRTPH